MASITSGLHYLLECHDVGGKNADGGYGGLLCQDPVGEEAQELVLVKQILAVSKKDRTFCYNNVLDPCPECHDLGGRNADGGYGGPLCQGPYG